MLADHRGIYGLGLLLTLGTAASLIAALIVLPLLLRLRHQVGGPTPPEPTAPLRIVPAEPAFERGG